MRKLLAALALTLTLVLPNFAFAAFDSESSGLNETATSAYGPDVTNDVNQNIGTYIGTFVIKPVIGLTGLVFLVLTVYAGFMWMTSAGDSKRIEKAKSILISSVVGAVIIASAYIIVDTVIDGITGGTTATEDIENAAAQGETP